MVLLDGKNVFEVEVEVEEQNFQQLFINKKITFFVVHENTITIDFIFIQDMVQSIQSMS